MSISDRVKEQRLRSQARGDVRSAKKDLRKAVDLKDPRFLGQAALAATRGPAGLAWFAASKGLEVTRERSADVAAAAGENAHGLAVTSRREPAEFVKGNRHASKASRKAAKRELKRLNKSERGVARRYAPLWVTALLGGVAVAGGTAWFLRDDSKSGSTPASKKASGYTPAPQSASAQGPAVQTSTDPTPSPVPTVTTDTADPDGSRSQPMDSTSAASTADHAGGKHELADSQKSADGSTSPVDVYREKGAAAATPADHEGTGDAAGHVPSTGANTGQSAASTPQPEDGADGAHRA